MKLVTAVIKPFKLDDVKSALETFGVHGHDRSARPAATAGSAATPRSTAAPSTPSTWCRRCASRSLVDDDDAEDVIDVIVKAAQTGRIGDGKVWSTPVETVVRVRTGERGVDAL